MHVSFDPRAPRARRHFASAWSCSLLPALLLALSASPGCTRSSRPDVDDEADAAARRPAPDDGMSHQSLAFPTGDRATSAILVEKVAPREVRVGRPFDYRIRVTNLTDGPLINVVVRERYPETLKVTRSDPAATAENGWAQYPVGELGPRQTRVVEVTAVPQSEGRVDTTIAVDYKPTFRTHTEIVNPVLKLEKTAPGEADVCEGIVYKYVVSNVGTGTERGVTVEDKLAEGLATDDGKETVVWQAGDLPAGASRERQVRVKPAKTGRYASAAVARSPAGGEAKSPETATVVRAPALEVSVSGPASEYVNQTANYTVTVKNTGDAAARRAVLIIDPGGRGAVATISPAEAPARDATAKEAPRDAAKESARDAAREPARDVAADRPARDADRPARDADRAAADARPARLLLVRDGGADIGNIPPGESRTFDVGVQALRPGPMEVTATAFATCAPKTHASTKTELLTLPALRLEVIDLADPVRVGEDVVYRVSVRNQGTGPDHNVMLRVTLPEQLTFVRTVGPTDAQAEGNVVRFDPLVTLNPGDTVVWRVQARAKAAGDLRLQVELQSESVPKPAIAMEPTKVY